MLYFLPRNAGFAHDDYYRLFQFLPIVPQFKFRIASLRLFSVTLPLQMQSALPSLALNQFRRDHCHISYPCFHLRARQFFKQSLASESYFRLAVYFQGQTLVASKAIITVKYSVILAHSALCYKSWFTELKNGHR